MMDNGVETQGCHGGWVRVGGEGTITGLDAFNGEFLSIQLRGGLFGGRLVLVMDKAAPLRASRFIRQDVEAQDFAILAEKLLQLFFGRLVRDLALRTGGVEIGEKGRGGFRKRLKEVGQGRREGLDI